MNPLPPEIRLARLAGAYQLSRAVQVAARMKLGRILAGGALSPEEIARRTASDQDVLTRLLYFLAELEVVEIVENDGSVRFGPTEVSQKLDWIDHPAQGVEAWDVWDALPEALRSGRPVFEEIHGKRFFDYLAERPEMEQAWATRSLEGDRSIGTLLAEHGEFGDVRNLVDVGGGMGAVAAEILSHYDELHAVVFELPSIAAEGPGILRDAGYAEDVLMRLEWLGGDARREVPASGDVFLLCRILFNWSDDDAVAILGACRRAMGASSRLWIYEPLRPAAGEAVPRGQAAADLHHFLLWGGRYRSLPEHAALCESAGLKLVESSSPLYLEAMTAER